MKDTNHIVTLEVNGVTVEFNEKTHRYKVNGVYTSGVTSILGVLDQGKGLTQWAVNTCLEAFASGVPVEQAKYAYITKRDEAADFGKQAHAYVENYLKTGEKPEPPNATVAECVNAFWEWMWSHKEFHIVHSEKILVSNEHKYCGTVDLIYEIEVEGVRKLVVGDFKTGNPEKEYNSRTKTYSGFQRPYDKHLLQCAMYDIAHTEESGRPADFYAVIYLTKEGQMFSFLNPYTSVFRSAAEAVIGVHNAMREVKEANVF